MGYRPTSQRLTDLLPRALIRRRPSSRISRGIEARALTKKPMSSYDFGVQPVRSGTRAVVFAPLGSKAILTATLGALTGVDRFVSTLGAPAATPRWRWSAGQEHLHRDDVGTLLRRKIVRWSLRWACLVLGLPRLARSSGRGRGRLRATKVPVHVVRFYTSRYLCCRSRRRRVSVLE